MSNLNNYFRIAGTAALIGLATPTLAHAQGKSGDKGKGKEKKGEKVERVEGGEVVKVRGDDDRRVVRTTVVAPPATALVVAAPTKPKKVNHVTVLQAVGVTRDVLVTNGYRVVEIVPNGSSQIVYYRRGNMGNGRGLGPVERLVVVPSNQVVTFQSVPQPLLSTILARLGLVP